MMRIAPLLLSGLALACGAQALAHAHFSPSTVAPGYAGPMAIHIGHGCDGQATERLTLYVPEQVTVTPMAKLNWQVSSSEVRGRVTQIVWSGSHLPNDQKDEFAFHLVAPKSIGAVAMAVKQECANGELFWQETAAKSRFPVARFQVSADAMAGVADAHDHDHEHHDHDHDHEHHDHDHDHDHHDHDHHAH